MTKKHYVLIATALWRANFIKDKNKVRAKAKQDMLNLIINNLVSDLKQDNPLFSADKFISYIHQ